MPSHVCTSCPRCGRCTICGCSCAKDYRYSTLITEVTELKAAIDSAIDDIGDIAGACEHQKTAYSLARLQGRLKLAIESTKEPADA